MKLRIYLGICLILLIFGAGPVSGAEYYLEAYDYYLNIPASWQVHSSETGDYLVFQDASGRAFFQVQTVHNFAPGSPPGEVGRSILSGLSPQIESADFSYNGHSAAYGTAAFDTGGGRGSGFFICIDLEGSYLLLFAYTSESLLPDYMPLLLSCMDGFSYSAEGLSLPGPVSQFYYPFPGPDEERFELQFMGERLSLDVDPGEVEASSVMIEREARILADLPRLSVQAWERYYRLIYRDSFGRLSAIAGELEKVLEEENGPGSPDFRTAASELLKWLQGFTYLRPGTVSDLQPPLQSVLTSTGDCDSLGLLYCILLDYLGIDSILLVSSEYSHSIAAVDVPGAGARFDFDGKSYLVAELTDDVDIGLIDSTMADPAKWIPISFAPKQ